MVSASKAVIVVGLFFYALTASAGKKRVTFDFQPTHPPSSPCLNSPLISWEESDSFFKDVKQVKTKGALEYRKGNHIIHNFPDEMVVHIVFLRGHWLFGTCGAGFRFDPATVSFHAEWRDGPQTRTANGTVVQSDPSKVVRIWCEDGCVETWEYQLRIESENVPLLDSLVIRMDGENGSRLAEYVGKATAIAVEQTRSPNLSPAP